MILLAHTQVKVMCDDGFLAIQLHTCNVQYTYNYICTDRVVLNGRLTPWGCFNLANLNCYRIYRITPPSPPASVCVYLVIEYILL